MIGHAALSSAGLDGHWKTRFEEPVLGLLRLHPVRRIEVFSGIGDELRVAWMINSFHSDDDVHQLWIVAMKVFNQFSLCTGWSRYENRTGVCNRLTDCVKIIVIF